MSPLLRKRPPPPVGYIIKNEVAKWIVTDAMVGVVNTVGGTGKRAQLEKWQVFGKTGTANIAKSNVRGYSDRDYMASFVTRQRLYRRSRRRPGRRQHNRKDADLPWMPAGLNLFRAQRAAYRVGIPNNKICLATQVRFQLCQPKTSGLIRKIISSLVSALPSGPGLKIFLFSTSTIYSSL